MSLSSLFPVGKHLRPALLFELAASNRLYWHEGQDVELMLVQHRLERLALELIAQARSALTKAAAGASDPSWLEKIGPYRGVIPGV